MIFTGKGKLIILGIIGIPILYFTWGYFSENDDVKIHRLPFYSGSKKGLGQDHKVLPFRFTNQDQQMVDESRFEDRIFVANFFFANCSGICPVMQSNMSKVFREFSNNSQVRFLSHTVKPEEDHVSVLKSYKTNLGIYSENWDFVTGKKSELYNMAENGYFLLEEGVKVDTSDFVHTQMMALVDWDLRIRGIYDGLDTMEIQRLISEIGFLLVEKKYSIKFTPSAQVNKVINKLRAHGCLPL